MGHKWTRPADGRHTYASLALASGKSIRWVAAQLGYSNPELTLRVYAHAMPAEDVDLSFLDFGGTKRHPRGTKAVRAVAPNRAHHATPRRINGKHGTPGGIREPAKLAMSSRPLADRNPRLGGGLGPVGGGGRARASQGVGSWTSEGTENLSW